VHRNINITGQQRALNRPDKPAHRPVRIRNRLLLMNIAVRANDDFLKCNVRMTAA
jgi:hypothetical protein